VTPLRVRFVVPVRNDAARLEMCLRSVLANHVESAQVEIVVVDNESTDGSRQVAARLGARVIGSAACRVSQLRNAGARDSSADVLVFVDADHEIAPGWLAAAIETLKMGSVGATGGRYRAPRPGTWVQQAYDKLRGQTWGRQDVAWLASGNFAVWRQTFDEVGGFDEALEACEDVDVCNRIRANGLRIVRDSRLENTHHGDPRTLGELFRKELWRGRDNLRVSVRAPFSWRALPSLVVPLVDLILVGITGGGAVAAFVGWRPGSLLAVGAVASALGLAGLRFLRASAGNHDIGWMDAIQVFVVACVYDAGRALALITRAPHHARRSATS